MWIIPSELTDALKGIGGMLGRGQGGFDDGGDDDDWVDPGEHRRRLRGRHPRGPGRGAGPRPAARPGLASREAEEHGAPASRVQPPIAPRCGCRAAAARDAPPPVVPPAPPVPFSEEQPPPPPPPAPPVAGTDEEPPAPPALTRAARPTGRTPRHDTRTPA